uniref:Thiol:disulfide interchange protein n=1 Tax=Pterothamnion crispum TaxID=1550583 RepID=A0A4D6WXP6_9FLOR|nr:Thiol:disulfide interchange protein [Pterothamnion crispum]
MFNFLRLYTIYEIHIYSFQQQVYSILSLQNRGFIIAKLISLFVWEYY